jgi:capsid protein
MARRTKKEKALANIASHLVNRLLVARYDSLKPAPTRKATEIRTDLSETEQNFTADKRILAYAKCDNLYDNTALASILDTSIRLTIGKRGGTPLFTGADKDTMQKWFTSWKRHAGYAEGESYYEMLALILRLVKLHGDCIVWVDPILTDGKIRVFDADQICNVAIPDFERWKYEKGLPEDARQVEGVVVDGTGKVYGYFVTMLRNRYSVNISDAQFLPIDTCRRVSYHRKHTQYRGEPAAFLANEELTEDTKQLLKSEIAAAKLASELPLIVEQAEGMDADQIANLIEGYGSLDELAEGTGIDAEQLGMLGKTHDDKTFQAFEGHAAVASVPNGTKVTNLNNSQRPSPQIQSFIDLLNDTNGRALGVMSCLSRGRADNSYSSGQIEIEISWKAFEEDQKMIERDVVDYVMETLYPNAEYEVFWDKAIQIDAEKSEKTYDMALRGGRTTYREILGTDWKQTLTQLADEKKFLKEIGLDNTILFQTSSGQELTESVQEHLPENN